MVIIQLGSSGSDVVLLQQSLQNAGFSPGGIDGDFGVGTQAAVIAFQRSEGLLPDGIVGPRTAAALRLPDLCRYPRRKHCLLCRRHPLLRNSLRKKSL